MSQNIYDNREFFDGYARLGRSLHGLDGAPEWPAVKAMLPDLAGKRIVDLGCGYGWFSRFARQQGAAGVSAFDLSEKMLDKARGMTRDPAIHYCRADMEELVLPQAAFDLAYSSLAFHYVRDAQRLLRFIHASLKPGGMLVCSVEHPIYTAPETPAWVDDAAGRKSWPVNGYQDQGRRVADWIVKGVVKYHRTLGAWLNMIMAAGFSLIRVEEWGPTDEQVDACPSLAEERERPMLLLVSALRPAAVCVEDA